MHHFVYNRKYHLLLHPGLHPLMRRFQEKNQIPKLFFDWRSRNIRELVFLCDPQLLDTNFRNICRRMGFAVTALPPRLLENENQFRDRILHSLSVHSSALIYPAETETKIQSLLSGRTPENGSATEPDAASASKTPTSRAAPSAALKTKTTSVAEPSPVPETPQPVSGSSGQEFQPTIFTIRTKLVGIISLIVGSALLGMILLATNYFKEDSKAQLQEQNLFITRLTATRVELELQNLTFQARTGAAALRTSGSLATAEYESFLFVGVYRDRNGVPNQKYAWTNRDLLARANLTDAQLSERLERHSQRWGEAIAGAKVLLRLKHDSIPLFALASPGAHRSMILVVFSGRTLQDSFQGAGSLQTFLITESGDLLAHPNEELVQTGTNIGTSPLVQKMRSAPTENEQLRYRENEAYYLGSFQRLPEYGVAVITMVPEELAFASVYRIQRRNLLIMVIFLTAAVLVVVYFSRTLSIPLRRLVQLSRHVARGDFNHTLAPASRDEIGELTAAFGKMIEGLGERDRMKEMLQKFASKEIAEKALSGELELGGENKTCVILFSDLRNFTGMSEHLPPEEVLKFLNDYYTEMANWIMLSHGTLDKFIGDAMMAWWGAVNSDGPAADTEHAVNAALMMRESLISLNKVRGQNGQPLLQFGVGINTGPVVAGQIGNENRLQYTVIGDSVNLASRVESLNKHHATDILITEASNELVENTFHTVKMPFVPIKGKTDRIILYAVLGRRDDPGCPKSLEELRELLGIVPQEPVSVVRRTLA